MSSILPETQLKVRWVGPTRVEISVRGVGSANTVGTRDKVCSIFYTDMLSALQMILSLVD